MASKESTELSSTGMSVPLGKLLSLVEKSSGPSYAIKCSSLNVIAHFLFKELCEGILKGKIKTNLDTLSVLYTNIILPMWKLGWQAKFESGICYRQALEGLSYTPPLSADEIIDISTILQNFMDVNDFENVILWDNTAGKGQHVYIIGVFLEIIMPGKVTVRASDGHLSSTKPKEGEKGFFPMVVEKMTAVESLKKLSENVVLLSGWLVGQFHIDKDFPQEQDPGAAIAKFASQNNTLWINISEGRPDTAAGSDATWDIIDGHKSEYGDEEDIPGLPCVYDKSMTHHRPGMYPRIQVFWDDKKPSTKMA